MTLSPRRFLRATLQHGTRDSHVLGLSTRFDVDRKTFDRAAMRDETAVASLCVIDVSRSDGSERTAQAGRREQDSTVDVAAHDEHFEFTYRHAQLPYRTQVRHDGRWRLRREQAVREVTLQPRQTEEQRLASDSSHWPR